MSERLFDVPARDVDDWATDPEWFARVAVPSWGPFTVDVAASAENAKCDRFYDQRQDGLKQPWDRERVWCNPPYSDIGPWLRKAHHELTAHVAMLIPSNRTERPWWQEWVEPYRDRPRSRLTTCFLPGRLRFLVPGRLTSTVGQRPPFPNVVLVWRAL